MASGVKVDWRVPSKEWERFVEHIHSEYGTIEGYVGREVEAAMREWVDLDGGNETEELVSRLVEAAGRTPEDVSQKKRTATSDLSGDDGETTRVTCRVHPDVKDEFKRYTKKNAENRVGVELAHAINTRRHGGRWQRVEDKLSRVVDDAEGLLSELDDESEKGLSTREKNTIRICRKVRDLTPFDRNALHQKIAEVAGDSKPTLRDYEEKVLDRLDYVEHPKNPEIFVPKETAEEYREEHGLGSADAPAIDRKDYSDLSRDERILGLQIEVCRKAIRNQGGYRLKAEAIKREVFDNQPSLSTVYDYMKTAGADAGFEYGEWHGSKQLEVTLSEVVDPDVCDVIDSEIEEFRQEQKGDEQTDDTPEESDREDRPEDEVSDYWDTYEQSHPAMNDRSEEGYAEAGD